MEYTDKAIPALNWAPRYKDKRQIHWPDTFTSRASDAGVHRLGAMMGHTAGLEAVTEISAAVGNRTQILLLSRP
jgi:hypothetical protein